MSGVKPIQFGEKYILLDHIGAGGVAEVFRGKLTRDKGFEKLIVIKKLLAEHNSDREMINVFIREARLAALLQHDNIAATYDFGEIDGEYFLAMEYLFGKNLYSVMARARDNKDQFRVTEALLIGSKICEGMEYAHNLTDLQSKPLNIVHRDLTPHNIFVTYDGKVKILDFGVAKAELFDNKTREGVVKGKISYMSPERLSGEGVDSRSDIFSIGILLYEMISKKRMYQGDTAELIRKCLTAEYENLKSLLPELEPAIYKILDKALAVEIDKRYQTCSQMQGDIDDLLFQMQQRVDSRLLKNTIQTLFAREYETEQQKVAEVLKFDADTPGRLPPLSGIHRGGYDPEQSSDDKTAVLYHRPPARLFKLYSVKMAEWIKEISVKMAEWVKENSIKMAEWVKERYGQIAAPEAENNVDKRYIWGGAGLFLGLIVIIILISRDTVDEPEPAAPIEKEIIATEETAESVDESIDEPAADSSSEEETAKAEVIEPEPSRSEVPTPAVAEPGARVVAPLSTSRTIDSESTKVPVLKMKEMKIKKDAVKKPEQRSLSKNEPDNENDKVEIGNQTLSFEEKAENLARRKQLISLHAKADGALREGRLIQPVQQSAYTYFSEILRLDPKDNVAADGFKLICEKYSALAEKSLAEKQYGRAEEYVNNGLSVISDYQRLIDIEKRIDRERQDYIFELSEKARLCMDAGKLSTPANDSAYFYYNEIFRIDPGNELVPEGRKKIANRYATLADQSFQQFDYRMAELYVKRGLQVVPDHYYLKSLKQELERSELERYGHSMKKRINKFFSE